MFRVKFALVHVMQSTLDIDSVSFKFKYYLKELFLLQLRIHSHHGHDEIQATVSFVTRPDLTLLVKSKSYEVSDDVQHHQIMYMFSSPPPSQ